MATHVLGIRHHGPGSARNVKSFLEDIKPDIVLVEGPPEANDILQWVSRADLKPPVAILCYVPDNVQQSCFYPFAEFSPEWQAILYARTNNIHVRFIDLPIANRFAVESERKNDDTVPELKTSPMKHFAEAAGYDDQEKWWEHTFENRRNTQSNFDAVNETMQVLRDEFPSTEDKIERLREASMRKEIRQAEKEMFQQIAVICGAWHAPALINMPKQKEDNELLKGVPKIKVECTWIPWTYNRLSYFSGYGAGINSPGWYEHLWTNPDDDGTLWMAKVAKLFREKQIDTSVAHVIEAVRLAQSLSSLRRLSKAGLEEMNEATLSVMCNGEDILLSLVHSELITTFKIGDVPDDIPKPPLQLDIEKTQKRLRLPATVDWKDYTLDLRKENDLERSVFLHRLQILHIEWGKQSFASGKGTFKEQWRLQWDPSFSVDIIEKGTYGNTAEEAATKFLIETAEATPSLTIVCELLEKCIPAELPGGIEVLIRQINNLSAASGDVMQLMDAVPHLVNVTRYGNVRNTDVELVVGIATSMITRICISLPTASTSIDEDASLELLGHFVQINDAVNLLRQEDVTGAWRQTLQLVAGNKNTSPIIAGFATRLLVDLKVIAGDRLTEMFYYAMSSSTAPSLAAAWLEGFLKGSGTLLLLDQDLWNILSVWVKQLDDDVFTQVLPLLRRTFANFTPSERRKMGEKARGVQVSRVKTELGFNEAQAEKGIAVVMQLFGYQNQSE